MDRRKFLSLWAAASLSACSWIPDMRGILSSEYWESVPDRVWGIVGGTEMHPEEREIMRTNYEKNLPADMSLLKQLLCGRFCGEEDFFRAIQNFQSQNGLTADGDIGPSTLRAVYARAMEWWYPFTSVQRNRLEILHDLRNYEPDRDRYPTSIPNVYNNRKFFGGGNVREFMPGTLGDYIAQGLVGKIPEIETPNTLYIEKIEWKTIMRLYNQDGYLFVATYVSPGTYEHQTPQNTSYRVSSTDKYHISSQYPEDGNLWAPMYAATHVVDGVWLHSSADTIDGYGHSHGCIRAGLHYAKVVHDYVARGNVITVQIGNLY